MTTGYSKSEKIDPWVSKSEGKGTKSEPRDTKSEPKGSQRKPKGAKSEPAGAKSEPTGAKSEPTGTKREPKVSQGATKMHQKIGLRKRSRKGSQNGRTILYFLAPFWSHFPLKIDEQIGAEQVMKKHEKNNAQIMRILIENL